jgi:hypothetical protein
MKKLLLLGVAGMLFAACSARTTSTDTSGASPSSNSQDTTMDTGTTLNASSSPMSSASPDTSMSPNPSASSALGNLPNIITVTLNQQNNSGQSGTAVIAPTKDGKVNVTLNLKGGNFTNPQPAHIHVGSCPKPGAVQYPLTNVVNGKSVTTLNVTMETLLASSDKLALNVHKSASDLNTYTACGDVK